MVELGTEGRDDGEQGNRHSQTFGGTLEDAEWLRDRLTKVFEEGVEWERNLQKEAEKRSLKWKAQRAKKKAKP